MTCPNPFAAEPLALANSSYARWTGQELVVDSIDKPPAMTYDVHAALRAILHDPDYPCVGAKSLVNQSSYRFGLYSELGAPEATAGLAYDLCRFVEERGAIHGEFASYIACFLRPKPRTARQFELLLWNQLRQLHELDRRSFGWNDAVSADVKDPRFSFCFAGAPFFVVGLSPKGQRWARRFPWPTLVFNDHFQFEQLREERRFDRLRDVIRERDTRVHGGANPMLEDFGGHSEARQYSGRRVGSDWACPVDFEPARERRS